MESLKIELDWVETLDWTVNNGNGEEKLVCCSWLLVARQPGSQSEAARGRIRDGFSSLIYSDSLNPRPKDCGACKACAEHLHVVSHNVQENSCFGLKFSCFHPRVQLDSERLNRAGWRHELDRKCTCTSITTYTVYSSSRSGMTILVHTTAGCVYSNWTY